MIRTRRLAHLALAVVPVLAAAACGSDDTSTDAASASTTPTSAAADIQPFCDGMVTLDATNSPGGPTDATPEAMKAFATEITPTYETMKASAPAGTADTFEAMDGYIARMADGEVGVLDQPEFATTLEALEQAVRDDCTVNAVDVEATNYKFEMPSSLPAGPNSVRITNKGEEPHVLLYVRKPDGTADDTAFLGDYLGAVFSGDPAQFEKFLPYDISGGGPFAVPGTSGTHLTNFTPGTYIYFCPIPQGATGEGPPHFTLGMQGEFTVIA